VKHEEERKELAALLAQERAELIHIQAPDDVEKKFRSNSPCPTPYEAE
jgi:hypothetical protein